MNSQRPRRRLIVRTDATRIAMISFASPSNPVTRDGRSTPESISSSSQYIVSSSSWRAVSNLLTSSAFERDLNASRQCAPTDVPERNICRPRTRVRSPLGSDTNTRITLRAKAFVLSAMVRFIVHPSSFILHPSSFILHRYLSASCTSARAAGGASPNSTKRRNRDRNSSASRLAFPS